MGGIALTLEEWADWAQVPRKTALRHWDAMAEDGVVVTDISPFDKKSRYVPMRFAAKAREKLFWLVYEEQTLESSPQVPPFLQRPVPAVVFNEFRWRDQSIEDAAACGQVSPTTLGDWITGSRHAPVVRFEAFMMRWRGVDIFEYIDINRDVLLQIQGVRASA